MFHTLLVALLLQSPNLTYTTKAVPLSQAVAAIAKQAGKKLNVGADLAKEPVVLRLQDVPVQDALDHLAEALGGEWINTDQGLTLTRTPAAIRRLLEERKARRLGAMVKGLASLTASQSKTPKLDAATADQIARQYANMLKAEKQGQGFNGTSRRSALSNRTADARLLADILKSLGPSTLAQLPAGHFVYAIDPTPVERPIPGIDGERLDRYVAERNLLATALERAEIGPHDDGLSATGIQQASKPIEKTPPRVLLDVKNYPSRGLFFHLDVYDRGGEQVGSSGWTFERPNVDEWFASRNRLASSGKGRGIKLPPDLAALAKRAREPNGKAANTLGPGPIELLLRPDLHDPLNLGFSQLLLGMGEQERLNVVATADDSVFDTALRAGAGGELNPEYVCELLSRWERQRFERRDGWLISTPQDLLYAAQTRLDRPSLAAFMEANRRDGYTSIKTWSDVALANPSTDSGLTVFAYRDLWRGQDAMYDYAPWAGYRLYGLLSDTQLEALQGGQALLYGTLGPDQRECIDQLVYEWDVLHTTAEDTAPDRNAAQYAFEERLEALPTESLPDGVPDNAAITMKDDFAERFYISTEFQRERDVVKESDQPVDIGWVANLIAQGERPDLFPPGTMETVKALRYGQRRVLTFTTLVAPTLRSQATLIEERKPEGDPIPVQNLEQGLPPEVWQRLNARIQELRAIYKRDEAKIRKLEPPKSPPPPPPPR